MRSPRLITQLEAGDYIARVSNASTNTSLTNMHNLSLNRSISNDEMLVGSTVLCSNDHYLVHDFASDTYRFEVLDSQ